MRLSDSRLGFYTRAPGPEPPARAPEPAAARGAPVRIDFGEQNRRASERAAAKMGERTVSTSSGGSLLCVPHGRTHELNVFANRAIDRILQPTATLVQDSGTSAERAPLFDKAVFRKATCTPVGSHFQKLRHAQVLFFCTGAVFLYCFSGSCEIFTDSCNERNIDLS